MLSLFDSVCKGNPGSVSAKGILAPPAQKDYSDFWIKISRFLVKTRKTLCFKLQKC